MEKRIKQIERKLKLQRAYTLFSACTLSLLLLLSFTGKKNNIIRAKGIVIVDDQFRERILIGAPIPYAKNRVRTDTTRVRDIWGKNAHKQYMKWYQTYDHSANGMVILDENGFDRVAVGNPTPDPNIGQRLGPGTGIVINSEEGYERSGYQLLNVEGKNRMVLGLDRPGGTEGVALSILEDGTAGLDVNSKKRNIFLGNTTESGDTKGTTKNFFGLEIKNKEGANYKYNSEKNNLTYRQLP